MMIDHYVRHLIRSGDHVRTEYECRAPEGAACRLACDSCIRAQYEQCECGSRDGWTDQGQCMQMPWLTEDAPEECYDGDEQPVRGPGWQAIILEWNGDNYSWHYEEVA